MWFLNTELRSSNFQSKCPYPLSHPVSPNISQSKCLSCCRIPLPALYFCCFLKYILDCSCHLKLMTTTTKIGAIYECTHEFERVDQATENLVEAKVEVCLSIDNCIYISRARESSDTKVLLLPDLWACMNTGILSCVSLSSLRLPAWLYVRVLLVFLSSETYRLIQSIPIDKYSRRI